MFTAINIQGVSRFFFIWKVPFGMSFSPRPTQETDSLSVPLSRAPSSLMCRQCPHLPSSPFLSFLEPWPPSTSFPNHSDACNAQNILIFPLWSHSRAVFLLCWCPVLSRHFHIPGVGHSKNLCIIFVLERPQLLICFLWKDQWFTSTRWWGNDAFF